MATDQPLQPSGPIEHHTTRAGRWLRARRIRAALWIAVIEGIIVALLHDVSRWTVIAVAIPLLALSMAATGTVVGADEIVIDFEQAEIGKPIPRALQE